MFKRLLVIACLALMLVACSSNKTTSGPRASLKMTGDIPVQITTPDRVKTRLGTLRFNDGRPDEKTVQIAFDNLDFLRGVEVFLNTCNMASLVAMRQGLRDVGVTKNGDVAVFEKLMDSNSLFLTPNTESIYVGTWLDLKNGPVVLESPPNTLGIVDDFGFRYVADMGNAGPDRGKGGKFLFLPPGYKGKTPKGYYTYQSPTYGNLVLWRGFLVKGDPKPGVESIKKTLRIYPLAKRSERNQTRFINVSGKAFNTIHANDFRFFEEVNEAVQEEPASAWDPETLGLLASIGIEKGKPFEPDDRMRAILTEAVSVGNATARALSFQPRDESAYFYPGERAWFTPFVGGSHEFARDGYRLLDARTGFFYVATMVTPAMTAKMVGKGSQYAGAMVDSNGKWLDGSKNYQLTLPKDIPAKDFWSLVLYDPQTRSMLQTDNPFPSISSQQSGVEPNEDGSYTVYFGPKAPEGKEKNWVQTVPGKGWFTILRLYGPLEPWFEKTWVPGDIEPVG